MINDQVDSDVDRALTLYANYLAVDCGEHSGEGLKLRAALSAFYPEFAKDGNRRTPRFGRAMRGWLKVAPAQRRRKVPEEAIDCITGELIDSGALGAETALYLQTMLSSYARPGEASRLRIQDIIPPGSASRYHTITLCPFEMGTPSKTGAFDDSVVLDDVRAPWLGKALTAHSIKRRQHLRRAGVPVKCIPEHCLWEQSHREHLEQFKRAVKNVNLQEFLRQNFQQAHHVAIFARTDRGYHRTWRR